MDAGRARERASTLWDDALVLALRAVRADATVADRSPFIGELARRQRRRRTRSTAPEPSGERRLPPEPVTVPHVPYYRPYVLLGLGVAWGPEPDIVRQRGATFQAVILFPFNRIDDGEARRWSPVLGAAYADFGFPGSASGWFAGAELGLAARIGRKPGVALHATWAPGRYAVSPNVSECFDPDPDRDAPVTSFECDPIRARSLRSFHFGATIKVKRFHFGITVRAIAPSNRRNVVSRVVTMTPMIGGNF